MSDNDDFPVNEATGTPIPSSADHDDPNSPSNETPPRSTSALSRRSDRRSRRRRPESRNSRKGPREGETAEEYKERKRRRREERKRKKEELLKQGLIEDDADAEKRERRRTKSRTNEKQGVSPAIATPDADEQPEASKRGTLRSPSKPRRKRREAPSSIQIPGMEARLGDASRVESFTVEETPMQSAEARRAESALSASSPEGRRRRSPSARKDSESRRKRREERETRRRENHAAEPNLLEAEDEAPTRALALASNLQGLSSPKTQARDRRRKKREHLENLVSSPTDMRGGLPQDVPSFSVPPQEELDVPITNDDIRRREPPRRRSKRRKSDTVPHKDQEEDDLLARDALEGPDAERWGTVRDKKRSDESLSDDERQPASVDGEDAEDEAGTTRIRNATAEDVLQPLDTDPSVFSMTRKLDNMLHFFSFTNPNAKPPQKSQKHSKFTSDVESRLTREIKKAVLNITVHKCDMLRLNTDVIHPVVRVTAIDSQTGALLSKHDMGRSAVFHREYVGKDSICEYILPVMVKPYDMRRMKSLIPQWENSIFYDQDYDHFLNPNVVFIFEIMEFDTRDPTKYANTDGMKKIAWAFLHPLSESGRTNSEKRIRLQLYHYPKNLLQRVIPSFLKKADPLSHAEVSFPFTDLTNLYHLKTKKKYPSTLHVTLSAYERPIEEQVTHRPLHQLQKEIGVMSYEEMYRMYGSYWNAEDEDVEEVFNEQENRKLNRMMNSLKRPEKEKCKIPDHLLFQLESGSNGCLCVTFSHNNEFIACACSNLNSTSTIKVYHVFTGKLAAEFEGHLSSLVYDIDWNQKDSLLCSASGDSTARIWNFGKKKQQLFNIQHPSFVYAAKFHPTFSTYVTGTDLEVDHLLVTGAYDHKIRFFVFSSNADFQPVIIKEVDTLHSARVNTLTFDPNGLRLFSGDGSGVVNVMSARVDTLARKGRQDEGIGSRRSSDSSALINEGTPLRGYTTDITQLHQSVNSSTMEQLAAWKNSDTLFTCIKTIKERDITRSTLTTMRIDPRHPENRLIVHSQDNLIRLLDLNNNVVLRRFSGVKCHINAQKSQVSPDGRYVISGSDSGKVFIWYKDSERMLFPDGLDFGFMNHPVYDIAWASDFHIVALCSYGSPEPIRLFTIEQDDADDVPNPSAKSTTGNIAKKFLGSLALGAKGDKKPTLLKVPIPNVIPKSPRRSPRGDVLRSPSGESLRVG